MSAGTVVSLRLFLLLQLHELLLRLLPLLIACWRSCAERFAPSPLVLHRLRHMPL